MCIALVGCHTVESRTVALKETKIDSLTFFRTDTLIRYHVEKDSIYLHDSVFIEHRGDTIFRDRWRVEYRSYFVSDSILQARYDSLKNCKVDSIPYEVCTTVVKYRTPKWMIILTFASILISIVLIGAFFMFRIYVHNS